MTDSQMILMRLFKKHRLSIEECFLNTGKFYRSTSMVLGKGMKPRTVNRLHENNWREVV